MQSLIGMLVDPEASKEHAYPDGEARIQRQLFGYPPAQSPSLLYVQALLSGLEPSCFREPLKGIDERIAQGPRAVA